jgi:hypothetical protein
MLHANPALARMAFWALSVLFALPAILHAPRPSSHEIAVGEVAVAPASAAVSGPVLIRVAPLDLTRLSVRDFGD